MIFERRPPQTVERYFERRFSIFKKICKSRPADTYYLDEMKKFTEMETGCYLSMKREISGLEELRVEKIVNEIDENALSYEYGGQSSENLASADNALNSSMSEHSRSK